MKLRAPATPLITVDPYFSVWSMSDTLNGDTTKHWTGKPNTMLGIVQIDGEDFVFLGKKENVPVIPQKSVEITAMSTVYEFENEKIRLKTTFCTPLLITELYYVSRPVSYLELLVDYLDGKDHKVKVSYSVTEEICLNQRGESTVSCEAVTVSDQLHSYRMGNSKQQVLHCSGDDIRIDWGYFYLTGDKNVDIHSDTLEDMAAITAVVDLNEKKSELLLFAYDDIDSIEYFHKPLKAYWHTKGKSITEVIAEAYAEYESISKKCQEFSNQLYQRTKDCGGEKYAELLLLSYRQILAAHKLVIDENGEVLYISKECFSNGCAATVDVTYPSAPFFLLYNLELLKGMLRPIFTYAGTAEWNFDFAPHDVGTYPLLNGQVYGENKLEYQMPVEECGNMLILVANVCMQENNADFAADKLDILKKWTGYLIEYGADPENQLCTDDFAGHLAHNCNLSLKAIMGIAGYAKILKLLGDREECQRYMDIAKGMASEWCKTAANEDGTYRLAYDQPNSFSMKYNAIWDKIWKTELFPTGTFDHELENYRKKTNKYGLPLDNRATYTKSDWLVWVASLTNSKEEFEEFIAPLWLAYHESSSRVPMTDWYFTVDAKQRGFQHRTVQGGLFIKLML